MKRKWKFDNYQVFVYINSTSQDGHKCPLFMFNIQTCATHSGHPSNKRAMGASEFNCIFIYARQLQCPRTPSEKKPDQNRNPQEKNGSGFDKKNWFRPDKNTGVKCIVGQWGKKIAVVFRSEYGSGFDQITRDPDPHSG